MKTQDAGNEVFVKIGARVVGVHNDEQVCMLVLENNPHEAIIVPTVYVDKQQDPTEALNNEELIQNAIADKENWTFMEGVDNPFLEEIEGE